MPLPKPRKGEKKDKFIERCMGDSVMNKDFEDNAQRYAVCNSQWSKKEKGGEEMELDVLDKLIARANTAMGKENSAKLSTTTRKKLKDSQFCLPGSRAFPVADCAHFSE